MRSWGPLRPLSQMRRVMRSSAHSRLAILEFSDPEGTMLAPFARFFVRCALSWGAGLVTTFQISGLNSGLWSTVREVRLSQPIGERWRRAGGWGVEQRCVPERDSPASRGQWVLRRGSGCVTPGGVCRADPATQRARWSVVLCRYGAPRIGALLSGHVDEYMHLQRSIVAFPKYVLRADRPRLVWFALGWHWGGLGPGPVEHRRSSDGPQRCWGWFPMVSGSRASL